MFNIGEITFVNVYLPSGTDSLSRNQRENMLGETLPNLLHKRKREGILIGDWNCIVNKEDSLFHPESKISPTLRRFIRTFDLSDFFRANDPNSHQYSHYCYSSTGVTSATRIDRGYWYGNICPVTSEYIPTAFSDDFAYLVSIEITDGLRIFPILVKNPSSR